MALIQIVETNIEGDFSQTKYVSTNSGDEIVSLYKREMTGTTIKSWKCLKPQS